MTHSIDHTKGQLVGTVSQQWAMRPDDEKFLDLTSLRDRVSLYRDESRTVDILPSEIKCNAGGGSLTFDLAGSIVEPSHWAFDQITRVAQAPAYYLRTLPAEIAAQNLNHGLARAEAKPVSAYVRENGSTSLRGITSVRYGRIFDSDVVESVMKIAGNGNGDTQWKVPGCIDWNGKHGVTYNPNVTITKQNTTLYASDRDVFLFLVDDLNPIEVGKLANGQPDLMFRGFYVWNSEVGSRTFGFASMYLRGVCQNRNLWGVEDFKEMTFKHTTFAPDRFLKEAEPALLAFSGNSTKRLIDGVQAAKKAIVARNTDERNEFLDKWGFSQKQAKLICDTVLLEENTLPSSIWDFAQGVSAVARDAEFQDQRLKLESIAGRMLDKVKVEA
jgi:hypothetical protein